MKNIAILMGGSSNEKFISIKSANTIYSYLDTNKYLGFKVNCIDIKTFYVDLYDKNIQINRSDFSFEYKNKKIKFDMVYNMIHGAPGENGDLCQYFEKLSIPYSSCKKVPSQLTFNKLKCNLQLKKIGYNVPIIYNNIEDVIYPCIVKPVNGGSSLGVQKVNSKKFIHKAINHAKTIDKKTIIEEFINGRELTCAVFNFKNNTQSLTALPITEIMSQNDIFDYNAKYQGQSKEITPANITLAVKDKIENISKKVYLDFDLNGVIRIDFILNKETPYIIEINTIPGFSKESIVPQMLKCAKIPIKQFIDWHIRSILNKPQN